MLFWHTDYSKLKLLKKQLQEVHSNSPFRTSPQPRKQEIDLPFEMRPLSVPGDGKSSLSPEIGNSGPRKLFKQTYKQKNFPN